MASKKTRWIIGGAGLAVILLLVFDQGNRNSTGADSPRGGDGSERCMVIVTVNSLNARSRPDGDAEVVETYTKGSQLVADRTPIDGYWRLGPGRWAAKSALDPAPGSDCG